MKTTIDAAGRVVIPKALRERVGLQAGMEIEVNVRDGLIEIAPPVPKGRLVREGAFMVWEPESGAGTVSEDEIVALIEEDRERRLDDIAGRAGL
jgi:AbrB family looped-hinge helix DNA binding protein